MTHSFRAAFSTFALLTVVSVASCRQASVDGHRSAVKSGAKHLPYAVEMEETYGKADHFITHYGMSDSPLVWNTEVHFQGRFVLTMQVNVSVDYSTNTVTGVVGEPMFHLSEVTRVVPLEGEQIRADFGGATGTQLGVKEWALINDANGDLSVIGVQAGPPIPLFDTYEAQMRAPRVPISLVKQEE